MIARIKNLRIRTIIGIFNWERSNKQDVVFNIELEFNGRKATKSDNIEDTVDYKTLTKRIVSEVEQSQFYLLEKLADHVLKIIMENPNVLRAIVEVDKPHALRFADSVSIICTAEKKS